MSVYSSHVLHLPPASMPRWRKRKTSGRLLCPRSTEIGWVLANISGNVAITQGFLSLWLLLPPFLYVSFLWLLCRPRSVVLETTLTTKAKRILCPSLISPLTSLWPLTSSIREWHSWNFLDVHVKDLLLCLLLTCTLHLGYGCYLCCMYTESRDRHTFSVHVRQSLSTSVWVPTGTLLLRRGIKQFKNQSSWEVTYNTLTWWRVWTFCFWIRSVYPSTCSNFL